MTPIAEHERPDAATFEARVVARNEPAVLRGLARDWPAVAAAGAAGGIAQYLRAMDSGARVTALRMAPSARGRIFYKPGLEGFNYSRDETTVSAVLEALAKHARFSNPPSVAVQSAPVAECLPGFAQANRNPLLADSVAARIWIGNRVVTPAHFDESSNIACVVAGRRRFTLFPPEAIGDLYIGPIGYAPTGTPISLVDFDHPDEARFPRLRRALEAARSAELEPGDAIYIPPLWWHHVRSLEDLNVLVNYWWKDRAAPGATDSALDALLLAMLNLRSLPAAQRRAWAAIFEHYVFGAGESTASHIPAAKRGVLGEMTPELARQVRAFLAAKLRD
jgi:hypothetical protein